MKMFFFLPLHFSTPSLHRLRTRANIISGLDRDIGRADLLPGMSGICHALLYQVRGARVQATSHPYYFSPIRRSTASLSVKQLSDYCPRVQHKHTHVPGKNISNDIRSGYDLQLHSQTGRGAQIEIQIRSDPSQPWKRRSKGGGNARLQLSTAYAVCISTIQYPIAIQAQVINIANQVSGTKSHCFRTLRPASDQGQVRD